MTVGVERDLLAPWVGPLEPLPTTPRGVFFPLVLVDQYPPLLGLKMVGKVCSGCLIVKISRSMSMRGVFIPCGLPAAASLQETVEHLDMHKVALLDY